MKNMLTILIILLAYVGASYLWVLYARDNIPQITKDSWYDQVLSYPMNLISKLLSKKS